MQQITHNFFLPQVLCLLTVASCWAERAGLPWWTLPPWGAQAQTTGSVQAAQERKTILLRCRCMRAEDRCRTGKQTVNELGRCENQSHSRSLGKAKDGQDATLSRLELDCKMSPESLAYCLVSGLLVQPTWWPDLSASGFSDQRPLLGESN